MTSPVRLAPRSLPLFAASLLAAGSAFAGSVYVPLPGTADIGSTAYALEVTVANGGAVDGQVETVLLPEDSDGTARGGAPTAVPVPAGRVVKILPDAAFRGLLEVTGPADMTTSVRWVGNVAGADLGVELPVIGSPSVAPAGSRLVLQGLANGSGRASDAVVVNLGKAAANCTLDLLKADGSAATAEIAIALQPLSTKIRSGLLNGLGSLADVRAVASCDQPFFAFATLRNKKTGELAVVPPAESGASTLLPPGEEPSCPAGATCLEQLGIVHQPTPGNPVGHLSFTPPVGTFRRISLSLDVTVGKFYPQDPDGKHLIYWFVINKNLDMLGMLYFRGPEAFTALVRHGINLPHAEKFRLVDKGFTAEVGHTYRTVNDYDMGTGNYTVTITDLGSGKVKSVMHGTPNVSSVTLKSTDRLKVDMGFPEGSNEDEVPAYGWTFRDAKVVLHP